LGLGIPAAAAGGALYLFFSSFFYYLNYAKKFVFFIFFYIIYICIFDSCKGRSLLSKREKLQHLQLIQMMCKTILVLQYYTAFVFRLLPTRGRGSEREREEGRGRVLRE
jgi:hypothetical protein